MYASFQRSFILNIVIKKIFYFKFYLLVKKFPTKDRNYNNVCFIATLSERSLDGAWTIDPPGTQGHYANDRDDFTSNFINKKKVLYKIPFINGKRSPIQNFNAHATNNRCAWCGFDGKNGMDYWATGGGAGCHAGDLSLGFVPNFVKLYLNSIY